MSFLHLNIFNNGINKITLYTFHDYKFDSGASYEAKFKSLRLHLSQLC